MDALRQTVTDSTLDILVFLKIDQLVEVGASFTAHDVTTTLRSKNSTLEIEHYKVKSLLADILNQGEMPGYTRKPDAALPGSPLRYQKEN